MTLSYITDTPALCHEHELDTHLISYFAFLFCFSARHKFCNYASKPLYVLISVDNRQCWRLINHISEELLTASLILEPRIYPEGTAFLGRLHQLLFR